jgi:hypothetical protein
MFVLLNAIFRYLLKYELLKEADVRLITWLTTGLTLHHLCEHKNGFFADVALLHACAPSIHFS